MFYVQRKRDVKTRVMVRKSESKTMFYVFKVRQRKHVQKEKERKPAVFSETGKTKACCVFRKRKTDKQREREVLRKRQTDRQTDRQREHVVFFIQKERMKRGKSGVRVKPHHEAHELRGIICFNL